MPCHALLPARLSPLGAAEMLLTCWCCSTRRLIAGTKTRAKLFACVSVCCLAVLCVCQLARELCWRASHPSLAVSPHLVYASQSAYFNANQRLLTNSSLSARQKLARVAGLDNKLTHKQRRMLFEILGEMKREFERNQIQYYMDFRTLLGSYRHHNLVPWDETASIAVHVDAQPLVQAIWPNIWHRRHNNTDEIFTGADNIHNIIADHVVNRRHRFFFHRGYRADKLCHTDGEFLTAFPWSFPFVNLFYFEVTERDEVHRLIGPDNTEYTIAADLMLPFHERPLGELQLMAPRDTLLALGLMKSGGGSGSGGSGVGYRSEACVCESGRYSLMLERMTRSMRTQCETLKHAVAFVRRQPAVFHSNRFGQTAGMKETLMWGGGQTLHTKYVAEPTHSWTEQFCWKKLVHCEKRFYFF